MSSFFWPNTVCREFGWDKALVTLKRMQSFCITICSRHCIMLQYLSSLKLFTLNLDFSLSDQHVSIGHHSYTLYVANCLVCTEPPLHPLHPTDPDKNIFGPIIQQPSEGLEKWLDGDARSDQMNEIYNVEWLVCSAIGSRISCDAPVVVAVICASAQI
jgi:hypothetical protein